MQRTIFLVGMMGAGKSSVATELAKQLGTSAYDSDAAVAEAAHMTIPEIFAREGSNVARFNIKTAQGDMQPSEVEITATSEETGKNETIVEATVDGGGLLIAFNVKFLREALEVIRTPNVALETSAPNAPGVVKPVGDDQFLHVIMPMHLG